jgi:hypothetical protein
VLQRYADARVGLNASGDISGGQTGYQRILGVILEVTSADGVAVDVHTRCQPCGDVVLDHFLAYGLTLFVDEVGVPGHSHQVAGGEGGAELITELCALYGRLSGLLISVSGGVIGEVLAVCVNPVHLSYTDTGRAVRIGHCGDIAGEIILIGCLTCAASYGAGLAADVCCTVRGGIGAGCAADGDSGKLLHRQTCQELIHGDFALVNVGELGVLLGDTLGQSVNDLDLLLVGGGGVAVEGVVCAGGISGVVDDTGNGLGLEGDGISCDVILRVLGKEIGCECLIVVRLVGVDRGCNIINVERKI